MHPEQITSANLETLRQYHADNVYQGSPEYADAAFDAWLSMQGTDTILGIINIAWLNNLG